MAKKDQLPKELLVYAADHESDGTPIYSVALNVDQIPEDVEGTKVGTYVLNSTATFRVKRELA